MSVATLIAVFVVVLVASIFQGSIGFGGNLIAQPIVYQFNPDLVPGSVLMATATLSCLVLLRDRGVVEWRPLRSGATGAIAGTGVGALIVGAVSDDALAVVMAVFVLAMLAIIVVGAGPPRTTRNLLIAGAIGGFGSTTAGIGGPPMALLFHDAEGSLVRGFLSSYFLFASVLSFAALALAGRFGIDEIVAGILLMPAGIGGFALSGPLLPVVDRGATRPAILIVSLMAAIGLLIRATLT